jgi:mannose-6-phosphate isomerase
MHAFEAMLALHETIGHPDAIARAKKLLNLMEAKFYDPETKTIGEFFTDQWTRAPGLDGETVEPGHQAEWAWLLRRYERLAGSAPKPIATDLLGSALRWSDPATGFLID